MDSYGQECIIDVHDSIVCEIDPDYGSYWGWVPAVISAIANGLLTPLVTEDLFSSKSFVHFLLYWAGLAVTFGLIGSYIAAPMVGGVVDSLTILNCVNKAICLNLKNETVRHQLLANATTECVSQNETKLA